MAPIDAISQSDDPSAMIPTADKGVRLHDLTLQTLNVFLPSTLTPTKRLFYDKEKFEGSLSSWGGRYFIYLPSTEHLNWESYLSNPLKELQKYSARIVGVAESPRIPETGTPRLDITGWFWDDSVNKMAERGELGISTDFNCAISGEEMIGYPTPNYIACFPIDTVNQQNDIGARVLNSSIENQQTQEDKMDDETRGAIAELKGLITGFFGAFKGANVQNSAPEESNTLIQATDIQPSVPVEYLNQIEQMKAENEATAAKMAELQSQYDALKATDEQRAEQAKQAEAQRLETVWQTTIMPKLPAALLVDEAKAAEIKALAIEKPLEFMEQYSDVLNRADINVANSNPTGQSHQNSNPEDKDVVITSYNAIKGGFD